MYVVNKVRKPGLVHQIAMTAHRRDSQTVILQHGFHIHKSAERHGGEYVLRPSLCGCKFHIVEASLRYAGKGIFQGKSMVTV